jgi:nucleoside-diphosphate-sugar epimerase
MILLTGATGYIGSHLLDELIVEYGKENIVILTSIPTNKCAYILHNNYNFETNYFIKSGFQSIDTIIHAGAFIPKSTNDADNIINCNSNIKNTEFLLSSNLPKLKKIIFLSTVDVYNDTEIIRENSETKPISLYGASKLYCEQLVSSWSNQNQIIYQILRVGHVYGPGEEKYQKIIPITMTRILKGESVQIYGKGNDIRSYIYITDVIKSIVNSLKLSNNSGVINIVSDEEITIHNLINKIIAISGIDVKIDQIDSNHIIRHLKFNNSKMKELLHSPEINIEEGLKTEFEYLNKKY